MSDKILEAITDLNKGILEQKAAAAKSMDEYKAALEVKLAEAKKEYETLNQKYVDEVKSLNEDRTKQGATLEEIRKEVLELKAKGGRKGAQADMEKKAAQLISEAFEEHFEKIKVVGGEVKPRLELKAAGNMTAAANLTGATVAQYNLTPAVRGRRKINFRDLVPVINSATGTWKFYRENTPVGQGSLAMQTTHGAVKNQLDYALTEVTVIADRSESVV